MQTLGEAMYMVFDLEPKGKYNVTDRDAYETVILHGKEYSCIIY